MSKTTGNVIDPLEMTDRHGTDALRFSLLTGSTPGNDMNLSEERIIAGRNFANKLWNMTRFVVTNLGDNPPRADVDLTGLPLALADRWILSRHNLLIQDVTRLIEAYQMGEAGRQIYEFLWGEFADWYIEMAKARLTGSDEVARTTVRRVLVFVLERCLRLLHPFMPFVTEAVWQHLPHTGEALMIARWPEPGVRDEAAEASMQTVMDVVRAIRNARSEYNVEPGRRIVAVIAAGDRAPLFASQAEVLVSLAHLDGTRLQITSELAAKPAQALSLVVGGVEVYLPLAGMVDLAAERQRLHKELDRVSGLLARSEKSLSNPGFVAKAPPEVVQKERDRLAELEEQAAKLRRQLDTLSD